MLVWGGVLVFVVELEFVDCWGSVCVKDVESDVLGFDWGEGGFESFADLFRAIAVFANDRPEEGGKAASNLSPICLPLKKVIQALFFRYFSSNLVTRPGNAS